MTVEHTDPFADPIKFVVTVTRDVSDRVNAKGIGARETLLYCLQDVQVAIGDSIRAVQSGANQVELQKQFDERSVALTTEREKVLAAVPPEAASIIAKRQAEIDAKNAKS